MTHIPDVIPFRHSVASWSIELNPTKLPVMIISQYFNKSWFLKIFIERQTSVLPYRMCVGRTGRSMCCSSTSQSNHSGSREARSGLPGDTSWWCHSIRRPRCNRSVGHRHRRSGLWETETEYNSIADVRTEGTCDNYVLYVQVLVHVTQWLCLNVTEARDMLGKHDNSLLLQTAVEGQV